MGTLHVEVVTAERTVLQDDVDMVIAPGSEGQLGILPRHAPLMTTLTAGELRLKKAGGEQSITITGGFLEVRDNVVTILADAAERVDEIDLARAEEAMKKAQERIKMAGADVALERASLRRAAVRVQAVRRRRSGSGSGAPPIR